MLTACGRFFPNKGSNMTHIASTLVVATIATVCLPGQTVRFQQSTDTIQLTHNTNLGSAATIEAVVYLDGGASVGSIFNEWTNNAEDKLLKVGPNVVEGYGLLAQGSVLWPGPLVTDRWHHVAYVFDGTQQRLFVDGQQVATHPGTGGFSNASGLGFLGDSPHPGHSAFRGFLESFRISTVARYTAPFTPPIRDMMSDLSTLVLYNFDEPAGSLAVLDSSGHGNNGTLGGIMIAGATSPALGIRVMTCQRATGGQINLQPVDDANGVVTVGPGQTLQGTVNLVTYNDLDPGAVAPLAGTAGWGSRTTQYWSIHPWISTGQNVYAAPISLTAPTQPGTYYLVFGFSGMYGADQVMSSTHPAIPAVWFDGNDVAFDWTSQQFDAAFANGGNVRVDLRLPNGTYLSSLEAFTAVRIEVGSVAVVTPIGPGCPGSLGVPLLQSTLPQLGTTAVLSLQNLVPGQYAVFAVGTSITNWNGAPLPLHLVLIGMPNCYLRIAPESLYGGGLNLGGFYFAGVSIPNNPSLAGANLRVQGLAFDPTANAFGAVLSNALTLTAGW